MTLHHVSAGLLVTITAIACGGQSAPVYASATTTTAQRSDVAVVDRLSTARCEQEKVCKNVGRGAKYASGKTCMDQLRHSIGADLQSYECRRGLDGIALKRCMTAIQGEDCNHPFETLTRFDRCRTGVVCMN